MKEYRQKKQMSTCGRQRAACGTARLESTPAVSFARFALFAAGAQI
jgi:hypothetical protein